MAAKASEKDLRNTQAKPIARTFFSVSDVVRVHSRFRPNQVAIESSDERCTWSQLDARASRVAIELKRRGLKHGEAVAILAGNDLWAWSAILGALRAGATVVPVSTMLTGAMVARFLSDCSARMLLAGRQWDRLAREATEGVDVDRLHESEGALGFDDSPCSASADEFLRVGPWDTCNVIYSSGTTGQPKGIVHSHAARISLSTQLALAFRMTDESQTLITTPPHTNVTWAMMLSTIFVGGTAFLMPHFDAGQVLEHVRSRAPSHAFLVPTQWRALLDHPDIERTDWTEICAVITGGAPMPASMKEEVCRRTKWRLFEIWGFTESVVTIQTPRDMASRPIAVGRPVVGCEIRIVNEHGADVTGKASGEIVGRSISLMDGYLGRQKDTSDLLWTDGAGVEFIRTGDIGEVDDAGYLTLRGRAKDMILSGGLNVYPLDIERVLMEHEGVSDVTVVGVPHDYWGETPVAFVIAKHNVVLDRNALMAWAEQRLARFQRLADVVVVEGDFPRNTLGKVIKHEIVAQYRPVPNDVSN